MLKKRLVGVITVKDGWAVQSFGYQRYLPLGRPETLAENLDRWAADEIIVQCIDRTLGQSGPDFDTIDKIGRLGLGTPIIYTGGIRHVEDGLRVIQSGADRIGIDHLLRSDIDAVIALSNRLGAQALIANLPVELMHGKLAWYNYLTKTHEPFSDALLTLLENKTISEVMLIDWKNEGLTQGYTTALVDQFPIKTTPLIAFGGISTPQYAHDVLSLKSVVAAAVGNFLNYQEHAISVYKEHLSSLPIRPNPIGKCGDMK